MKDVLRACRIVLAFVFNPPENFWGACDQKTDSTNVARTILESYNIHRFCSEQVPNVANPEKPGRFHRIKEETVKYYITVVYPLDCVWNLNLGRDSRVDRRTPFDLDITILWINYYELIN